MSQVYPYDSSRDGKKPFSKSQSNNSKSKSRETKWHNNELDRSSNRYPDSLDRSRDSRERDRDFERNRDFRPKGYDYKDRRSAPRDKYRDNSDRDRRPESRGRDSDHRGRDSDHRGRDRDYDDRERTHRDDNRSKEKSDNSYSDRDRDSRNKKTSRGRDHDLEKDHRHNYYNNDEVPITRINITPEYPKKHKDTVTVYGSGDLGRGLVACLVRGGIRAVVASRNPAKSKAKVESIGGEIAKPQIAIQESDVILVAIPFEAYKDLKEYNLKGKILVDVSNRPPKYDRNGPSMAENLQSLIPNAIVVKAMNTLSAYALSRGLTQGSKQVPVCSDDEDAKTRIMELVQKLGFSPVDFGTMKDSKKIEDIPLVFFPEWKAATFIAIFVFFLMWLTVCFRKQLCPNFQRPAGTPWKWDLFHSFPLKASGNASAITSFNLLAACYFPGVLASYIQLYRGTKYSEFPRWLDNWMKARKQLGLIALLLGAVHGIFAIAIKISVGMPIHWREQGCLALGAFSLGLMAVLGITSLPSVSATLTWKEFFFVQSYLGWASLVVAYAHTVFAEFPILLTNQFTCVVIPHHAQVGIILPTLTVFFKIPLLIPCVDNLLVKIRRGYERNADKYSQKPVNAFTSGYA